MLAPGLSWGEVEASLRLGPIASLSDPVCSEVDSSLPLPGLHTGRRGKALTTGEGLTTDGKMCIKTSVIAEVCEHPLPALLKLLQELNIALTQGQVTILIFWGQCVLAYLCLVPSVTTRSRFSGLISKSVNKS